MIEKKRTVVVFLLTVFLLIFLALATVNTNVKARVVYKSDFGNYPLSFGKNMVKFDETIYAPNLVDLYPDIDYISYFDQDMNTTVAYVNVFGGIGKNFLIYPDRVYEISVKKDINITLP